MTTALAGVSSADPTRYAASRAAASTRKQLDVPPDWRIACCYVGKGRRRQGVATAALAGALELIAESGGGRVEGHPEPADAVPAGFLIQWRAVHPRTSRVRPRPQDRQAPLGRHPTRRGQAAADRSMNAPRAVAGKPPRRIVPYHLSRCDRADRKHFRAGTSLHSTVPAGGSEPAVFPHEARSDRRRSRVTAST